MTLIVNLYGGPGSGKSTTAASAFSLLKGRGRKVELVTEAAKDLTYEKSPLLGNNLHILSEQYRRLSRLRGKVDVVLNDSPLLLSLAYVGYPIVGPHFTGLVAQLYRSFNNLDIFVKRVKPYAPYGRNQSEDEAKELDKTIADILSLHASHSIVTVLGDQDAGAVVASLAQARCT